jgi:redox-sensitive bicupin YhaK (pirin superfamily)
MKKTVHKNESRGSADHGWLKARHTFSFAGYHNPSRVHFGLLRVLNDDIVDGGMGFGAHPHDNMEIITVPLSGALHHKDNTGRSEIIRSGDVQIMSAGSGIVHSEMNASKTEPVNLLQIWIFPKEKNISPRYEQKTFSADDRKDRWQIVVSPDKTEGGVWINQDARFALSDISAGTSLEYKPMFENSGLYIFILDGKSEVTDELLEKRDAIALSETGSASIKAIEDTSVLLMEIPMN